MINYKFERKDNVNDAFSSLYQIVSFLRDPENGCPWDKEQTPKDIIRSMQGEIYEYIDALLEGKKDHVKEELGDIFLNLFLLAKIHDQEGDFSTTSVLNDTCEKYIRRHPHVFSDVTLKTAGDVIENWQKIKKEKEGRKDDLNDFFSNIPINMPEIEKCYKISKKAAKVGFEWSNLDGVYDKLNEEINESKNTKNKDEDLEELGDILFTAVNLCRYKKINPADALSYSNRKFMIRFNKVFKLAQEAGKKLEELTFEEWDYYWSQAKKQIH